MRQLVNMRLPTELLARVDSVCGPRGRTEFVMRALEKALSAGERSEPDRMPVVARPGSAPPRAPQPDLLSQRQARLNAAREKRS
jgi:hypothetical protein